MKYGVSSDINQLRKVIKITNNLLDGINKKHFLSPYSIIPIISQILGLNAPLLGSGKSPYSIFSIIIDLAKKKSLFREAFTIPFSEKRVIVDEIYNAIAPCLLEEEDNYIQLLLTTRYRKQDKSKLKDKIYLIKKFILQFHRKNAGNFAHIAHYGYPEDLNREYNFIKYLPKNRIGEWFQYAYPVVNELMLRNNNREIKGWIIFIANSTEQLLKDGKLRKRKILQVALLANKLGAKIVGMGGLVASFAEGGYYLAGQIKNIGFTTGHAYTIGNILQIAEQVSEKVGLNLNKAEVAVVGAAGSIGSGCAKLLAERGIKKLILVEITSFSAKKRLEELKKELEKIASSLTVTASENLIDIKTANLIIVATNSPTSLIKSQYLKSGAIIIDDSFPKNVPKKILSQRKDIILLEGGAVSLPLSVDIDAARNMPDLMDAPLTRLISCKEVYGCFAEVLTLAMIGYKGNYGLGQSNPRLARDIMSKSNRIGFCLAPLQCYDQVIPEERYKKVSDLIKRYELF